jgi:glycosyltransferase involved in cell wall biosynthesis
VKVTIIGPAHPLRGGIAHHVHAVRQGLVERGHTLQVISFRRLYLKPFFPGRTEYDTSDVKLEAEAEPILVPLNPLTWIEAVKKTAAFSPDSIVVQWWNPFFGAVLGSLARMLARRELRCIFECHNVIPHEHSTLLRPLLHYGLAPVSRFIVHSNSDRDILMTLKPEAQVLVAPLPRVSMFRGSQTRDRSGRRILFFGLVRRYKGLSVLLQAMPKVLERVQCELSIVGEFYEPVERYEEMIRSLGIADSVHLENRYVANEEVTGYFDQADVLVMPYLSATQSAVAGIAIANALPIIASRTGGLRETVNDGRDGMLVPANDPDALADALIRYFEEGLGASFSENLRARLEDENASEVTTAIEQLSKRD